MEPLQAAEAFLNHGVEYAMRSVADHGAFYPFGLRMDTDGKITMATARIDESTTPTQDQVLELLWSRLREDVDDGAQAVGVFTDVGLKPGVIEGFHEAVELAFEHAEGHAEAFIVPYRRDEDGFALGPLLSQDRQAMAFTA